MTPSTAAIEARLKAATPGPWQYFSGNNGVYSDGGKKFICGRVGFMSKIQRHGDESNGQFIANAPTDIAFLLAEVKRKDEALRQAEKSFSNLANILDNWARESQRGGWSTHQVSANEAQANYCRRDAAKLAQALNPKEPQS